MQRGASLDGAPPPALAEYYGRFAAGGFALVMSESCAIDHPSASRKVTCVRMLPSTLRAWRECTRQVEDGGAHMMIQLWHEGALRLEGDDGVHPHAPTLSPSGLFGRDQPAGRAMTESDLDEVKASYVRAAMLAQEAGAIGVEIHGGHGFLLDQFLWSETNRRADRYGGAAMADRVRFPAEIIAAIRAATGGGFLIGFRFSQWKGNHGRRHPTSASELARIVDSPQELETMLAALRSAGVDLFHVSARRFDRPEWPDSELSLAGWTKRLTDAPVIAVGSVGLGLDVVQSLYEGREAAPHEAVAILEQSLAESERRFRCGEFDLLAVGRASLGDQAFANKVFARRLSDIFPYSAASVAGIVRAIR
jgi:2,4-dienoyl-CoA reductase-like NADH-dependent reductase (Old Yellow Enzyme family)